MESSDVLRKDIQIDKDTKTRSLRIRVTQEEKDILEYCSKLENRTVSNYILNLVKNDYKNKISKD
ncbi:DUF1778 domain-containing protein [Clostridioides difficile]|nr:DUF1778 domain-containing protein [Clostridioides difficile]MCZ8465398.1 DUF1778 domain-containing protein [Clostridioides difficile]MDI2984193.1 DUF1778 domain-containing protein [Clostridioides difficile]MDI7814669.1 DUF1778 domain-containing protein [Clostridioides difficile]HBF3832763.1 DUF1778 domain-containing protein [Clostridioides difficile]